MGVFNTKAEQMHAKKHEEPDWTDCLASSSFCLQPSGSWQATIYAWNDTMRVVCRVLAAR